MSLGACPVCGLNMDLVGRVHLCMAEPPRSIVAMGEELNRSITIQRLTRLAELEAENVALRAELARLRTESEALRTVTPVTPDRNANAERQRRFRERKRAAKTASPISG